MTTTAQFPATIVRRSHFDGQVLTPGTRGYDSARSVWNGMIDHRPKLIVRLRLGRRRRHRGAHRP